MLRTYQSAARRRPEIRSTETLGHKADWRVAVRSDGAECLSNIQEARRKRQEARERSDALVGRAGVLEITAR